MYTAGAKNWMISFLMFGKYIMRMDIKTIRKIHKKCNDFQFSIFIRQKFRTKIKMVDQRKLFRMVKK